MNTIAEVIREAAYKAVTVFKFRAKSDTDEAEDLLKKAIDGGEDITYSRDMAKNAINVSKKDESKAHDIFTKAKCVFKVDEGVGRQAALEPRHFIPDIKVEVKTHYGSEHKYITSDHAEAVAQLTGKKTLTERDIQALKALGFTVYQQAERKAL